MPLIMALLWTAAGFGLFAFVKWINKEFNLGPVAEPITRQGKCTVVELDHGAKAYVGRSGAFPWIRMPETEQTLTAAQALVIVTALTEAAEDAIVFSDPTLDNKRPWL